MSVVRRIVAGMKRTLSDDVNDLDVSMRQLGNAIAEALHLRAVVSWLGRKAA